MAKIQFSDKDKAVTALVKKTCGLKRFTCGQCLRMLQIAKCFISIEKQTAEFPYQDGPVAIDSDFFVSEIKSTYKIFKRLGY